MILFPGLNADAERAQLVARRAVELREQSGTRASL